MSGLSRDTRGVIPIVPTPFRADGAIAFEDIPGLVDYYRRCGVDGLTILGVMGEATKLSIGECLEVVAAFVAAAGDLPVVVGVSGGSLAGPVELARKSLDAGAFGVMLQPMPGLSGDAAVAEYFARFCAQAPDVPLCVQDYPQVSGVAITAGAWAAISQLDTVFMLKHEPPAGLGKLSAIRQAERDGRARRVAILTSNNAMHLPQELDRGADGAMVGVALSDIVVAICRTHRGGDGTRAHNLYDAVLPLIRHETQGAFGLAIRKEILRRRGALIQSALRYPAVALDATDLAELDLLMDRASAALAATGLDVDLRKAPTL